MAEQATRQAPATVTRYEAACLLGVSVKRVDQLRREGHLGADRNPLTGKVTLRLDEVRELLALRGGKAGPARRWVFRRSARP